MKYALLAYDHERSLDELAAADKRALHLGYAALHDATSANSNATLISHYRFRSADQAITVRREAGDLISDAGPASSASATLRALYLVESDDRDTVVALAAELPAVRAGATIEIWPLSEPTRASP